MREYTTQWPQFTPFFDEEFLFGKRQRAKAISTVIQGGVAAGYRAIRCGRKEYPQHNQSRPGSKRELEGWARLRWLRVGGASGELVHARVGDPKIIQGAQREALRQYTRGASENEKLCTRAKKQWRVATDSHIVPHNRQRKVLSGSDSDIGRNIEYQYSTNGNLGVDAK
eukprot:6183184-Pleurochrysis_carterae.AAC.2